jgi:hypothetical protein
MTIRQAGKGVVVGDTGMQTYRIGFVNLYGEEDETEINANNMKDLEQLWSSLCDEFECRRNSVTYIERMC